MATSIIGVVSSQTLSARTRKAAYPGLRARILVLRVVGGSVLRETAFRASVRSRRQGIADCRRCGQPVGTRKLGDDIPWPTACVRSPCRGSWTRSLGRSLTGQSRAAPMPA
jgi:hypothetical protein